MVKTSRPTSTRATSRARAIARSSAHAHRTATKPARKSSSTAKPRTTKRTSTSRPTSPHISIPRATSPRASAPHISISRPASTSRATLTPRRTTALKSTPSRTSKKPSLPLPAKIAISLICASVVGVIIVAFCALHFTPEYTAKKTLERLASDYYIEHYYPSVLGSQISTPEPLLSAYASIGLPSVRLRQVLLRTPKIEKTYSSYFSDPTFTCDLNNTTLRFYPIAPYGPRDYRLTINFACQDLTR